MTKPISILLQTTIPRIEDDWHIGRFGLLRTFLADVTGDDGVPLFTVTARDRVPPGEPDPVMSTLDGTDYQEMWLFAVDTGDGLTEEDCAGISRFRQRGGGLMVTRDHMDLGCSVCTLGGIGAAHYFHSKNPDPDPARRRIDDPYTREILWPNYHSGANGDYQEIWAAGTPHPVLIDPAAADSLIHYLPAHPHEGAVGAPANDSTARVIATGRSRISGLAFNIAVAFDPSDAGGPAVAESTFHHFADYNWDLASGAPSFVDEPPGDGIASFPEARRSTERYVRNLALWLAGCR
ncbi:MAG TPA: hypothetical protein VGL55_02675 [Steroidobacteraceae bacterium]